jgi:hypothetical protein
MGCLFRLVVDFEHDDPSLSNNWITAYGLDPNDNYPVYVTALYWAAMTITTVGYGDVPSQTDGERIVVIICMMIGAGVFAYFIGSICGVVQSMHAESVRHRELMDSVQAFIKSNVLPSQLGVELRSYFIKSRKLRNDRYNAYLLDEMSPELRAKVMFHTYSRWLVNIPFFTLDTSKWASKDVIHARRELKAFVMRLATLVSPVAYGPMETIARVNERCHFMVIIKEGRVAVHLKIMETGDYFGQEMLMEEFRWRHNVIALTFVNGFRLEKSDLFGLVEVRAFPRMSVRVDDHPKLLLSLLVLLSSW